VSSSFNKIICLLTAILVGSAALAVVFKERPAVAAADNCGCHPNKTGLKFVHTPVKGGECSSCHKPTDQKHPKVKKGAFLLTDKGKVGLCNECHDRKDSMKFVHGPVASGDCIDCHDVHQSNNKFQLKEPGSALCFSCHDKAKLDRKYPHAPIADGRCTGCHDPHQSNVKFMLKAEGQNLCMMCHDKKLFSGKSVHPPVASGECSSCHSTHGTSFPHLLKKAFPEDFYLPFDKGQYALCFECHSNALADDQLTGTQTNFRNGMSNLHYLHVNKADKGRSCKTCHDPHASSQPKLISSKVSGFGRWRIPIRYTKTDVGGTCIVGCHKPKSYDRVNQAVNP
jgi:predicted CXXCH cytochrome family protein